MSVGDRVAVSLEVQIGQAVATLNSLMTGLKGIQTQITQVKSTAAGGIVSGDPLRGLTSSMTAAETKVSTFGSKLKGLGSAVGQQATSFGVASASIWGAYNAYDSLVKVELRAETASNRVKTMTTTLATLQERHTEALQKHNLSATEMAILEEKITNTKAKLATAQVREADLQGDVNEAWAGFASQIGPQVVAAGASIVQLFATLNGSFAKFGGLTNVFKNAFISLIPPLAAMKRESLLLNPALGGVAEGMNKTSLSVKGLMLSLGPIALIIAGITAAWYAYNKAQENVAKFQGAQKIAAGITDVTERIKVMNKNIDEVADKPFGDPILDFIFKLTPGAGIVKLFTGSIKESNAVMQMTSGTASGTQAALDSLNAAKSKLTDTTKTLTSWDKQMIEEEIAKAQAIYDSAKAAEASAKAHAGLVDSYDPARASVNEFLNAVVQEKSIENDAINTLLNIANVLNIDVPKSYQTSSKAVKDYILSVMGLGPHIEGASKTTIEFLKLFGDGAKTIGEFNKRLQEEAKIQDEYKSETEKVNKVIQEQNDAKQELAGTTDLLNKTFGTSININKLGTDEMKKLVDIANATTLAFKEEEFSIAKIAAAHGVAIPKIEDMVTNLTDERTVMNDLIGTHLDYTRAITDTTLHERLLSEGFRDAAVGADDFLQGLVRTSQEATTANTIYTIMAEKVLGHDLPAGIKLTTDELKRIISAQELTKNGAFELSQILSEKLAPSFAALSGAFEATDKKGLKDFFKSMELPKGIGKIADDIVAPLQQMAEHGRKAAGAFHLIAVAGEDMSKSDLKKVMKGFGDELDKIGKQKGVGENIDKIFESIKKMSPEEIKAHSDAMNFLWKSLSGDSPDGPKFNKAEQTEFLRLWGEKAGVAGDNADTAAPKVATLTEKFGEFAAQAQQVVINAVAAASVATSWGTAAAFIISAFDQMKSATLTSIGTMTKTVVSVSSSSAASMATSFGTAGAFILTAFGKVQKAGNTLKITFPAPDIKNVSKAVDACIEMFVNFERVGNKVKPTLHVENKQAISAIDNVVNRLEQVDGMSSTATITVKHVDTFETKHFRYGGSFVSPGFQHGGSFIANTHQNFKGAEIAEFNKPELVTVTPLTDPNNISDRTIKITTQHVDQLRKPPSSSGPIHVHIDSPIYLYPSGEMVGRMQRKYVLDNVGKYPNVQ